MRVQRVVLHHANAMLIILITDTGTASYPHIVITDDHGRELSFHIERQLRKKQICDDTVLVIKVVP